MTTLRTIGLGGAAAGLAGLLVFSMLPGGPPQSDTVRQASRPSRPTLAANEPARQVTRPRSNEVEIAAWMDTILARPLFFPSRRPPPPAAPGPPPPDEPVPRLTGVLVSAASSGAIFAMDGKPHLAHVGDRLGGFTVRAITPGEVRLEGPAGVMTLHPAFASGSGAVGSSSESTGDTEEDGQSVTPAKSGTGGNPTNGDKVDGASLLDRLRAEMAHQPQLAMPPRPSPQSLIARERKSE